MKSWDIRERFPVPFSYWHLWDERMCLILQGKYISTTFRGRCNGALWFISDFVITILAQLRSAGPYATDRLQHYIIWKRAVRPRWVHFCTLHEQHQHFTLLHQFESHLIHIYTIYLYIDRCSSSTFTWRRNTDICIVGSGGIARWVDQCYLVDRHYSRISLQKLSSIIRRNTKFFTQPQ